MHQTDPSLHRPHIGAAISQAICPWLLVCLAGRQVIYDRLLAATAFLAAAQSHLVALKLGYGRAPALASLQHLHAVLQLIRLTSLGLAAQNLAVLLVPNGFPAGLHKLTDLRELPLSSGPAAEGSEQAAQLAPDATMLRLLTKLELTCAGPDLQALGNLRNVQSQGVAHTCQLVATHIFAYAAH